MSGAVGSMPELDAQRAALLRGRRRSCASQRPRRAGESTALRVQRTAASEASGRSSGPMLDSRAPPRRASPPRARPSGVRQLVRPRPHALSAVERASTQRRAVRRRSPRRPSRQRAQPRAQEAAALLLILVPLRAARARLDGLRDDDGRRRPTCPRSRTAREYQTRANSMLLDVHGSPRRPDQQPEPHPRRATSEIAPVMKQRDHRRSRTGASTTNSGVDIRGIGRAFVQDVVQQRRRAGRLDDHPAVRQERAARPGQAHASSRSCARRRWPTT